MKKTTEFLLQKNKCKDGKANRYKYRHIIKRCSYLAEQYKEKLEVCDFNVDYLGSFNDKEWKIWLDYFDEFLNKNYKNKDIKNTENEVIEEEEKQKDIIINKLSTIYVKCEQCNKEVYMRDICKGDKDICATCFLQNRLKEKEQIMNNYVKCEVCGEPAFMNLTKCYKCHNSTNPNNVNEHNNK